MRRIVVFALMAGLLSLATIAALGVVTTQASPIVAGTQDAGIQGDANSGPGVEGLASSSTLPLRYQTGWIRNVVSGVSAGSFCVTVIIVRNLTASPVQVNVSWQFLSGSESALRAASIAGGKSHTFASDDGIDLDPFVTTSSFDNANLGGLNGFADIHADDPRILVQPIMLCRQSAAAGATQTGLLPIHAQAVGATLDYFMAGAPASGDAPIAESSR